MTNDRINALIPTDRTAVAEMFAPFDPSAEIVAITVQNSMSNTGCVVDTSHGRYFLKIYSKPTDKAETAAYKYLHGKLDVSEVYYYDGGRERFPFAYTVSEYIGGGTFSSFVRDNAVYPADKAYRVGQLCATLHKRGYLCEGLLDGALNISKPLPSAREEIALLLDGRPAKHLRPETVLSLRSFIRGNPELFSKIESSCAFCHGDFGYGNIMLQGGKLYLIDFEFACAGSIYADIGHFFRRKDDDVQAKITDGVYSAFTDGYNSVSAQQLDVDWMRLAALCDIKAMLRLLNFDSVPQSWISDIERDILSAIT